MYKMTPRKVGSKCLRFALPTASTALQLQKTSQQLTMCSFPSVFPFCSTVPHDFAPLCRFLH